MIPSHAEVLTLARRAAATRAAAAAAANPADTPSAAGAAGEAAPLLTASELELAESYVNVAACPVVPKPGVKVPKPRRGSHGCLPLCFSRPPALPSQLRCTGARKGMTAGRPVDLRTYR